MISDQYWNYLYHMNTYRFSTEPTQLYYRAMNTYESLLAYTIVRNSLRTIRLAKINESTLPEKSIVRSDNLRHQAFLNLSLLTGSVAQCTIQSLRF